MMKILLKSIIAFLFVINLVALIKMMFFRRCFIVNNDDIKNIDTPSALEIYNSLDMSSQCMIATILQLAATLFIGIHQIQNADNQQKKDAWQPKQQESACCPLGMVAQRWRWQTINLENLIWKENFYGNSDF